MIFAILINVIPLTHFVMHIKHFTTLSISLVLCFSLQSQVTGLWKTIGDVDGTEKSIVEIYEENGKLYGRVLKLLPSAKHTICYKCPGELKDKPIEGMIILYDLHKTSNGGNNGKAFDPSSGNTYKCNISLEGPDKLKVRGYIGVPTIGRTQYWYRVK